MCLLIIVGVDLTIANSRSFGLYEKSLRVSLSNRSVSYLSIEDIEFKGLYTEWMEALIDRWELSKGCFDLRKLSGISCLV